MVVGYHHFWKHPYIDFEFLITLLERIPGPFRADDADGILEGTRGVEEGGVEIQAMQKWKIPSNNNNNNGPRLLLVFCFFFCGGVS